MLPDNCPSSPVKNKILQQLQHHNNDFYSKSKGNADTNNYNIEPTIHATYQIKKIISQMH